MKINYTKFSIFAGLFLLPFSSFAQNKQFTFLFETAKTKLNATESVAFMSMIKSAKIDSITIQGHCDSIGSTDYNQALSEARTNTVRAFLLQNGVKKVDIKIWEGLGEVKPIASNDNDADRSKNRRVEVYLNAIPAEIMQAHLQHIAKKVVKPIELKKAKFTKGEKLYLPNLTFEGNRHVLTPDGETAFLELLATLKKNESKKIMIVGHICCTMGGQTEAIDLDLGTPDLSKQRAKEIYDKLVENGIDKKRMQFKGAGSLEKIYPYESNLQEQQANRRVEIIIIE
jgi:outer membrane protein OmpA-like peptidoglycan-associated protein